MTWICEACGKPVQPISYGRTLFWRRKYCSCSDGTARDHQAAQEKLTAWGLEQSERAYYLAHRTPSELVPGGEAHTFETYNIERQRIILGGTASLDELVRALKAYAVHAHELGDNCNVLLAGDTCLGKTHLAEATFILARETHKQYRWPLKFVSWPEYLEEIKASWDSQTINENQLWRSALEAKLLVLDGFDINNKWSDWVVGCMYRVLDWRVNRSLPTLITMNCTTTELQALMAQTRGVRPEITEAIVTRIKRRLAISVHMTGTRWIDLREDEKRRASSARNPYHVVKRA